MISKPNDWILLKEQGENRLVRGGYLKNKYKVNVTALLESSSRIFKIFHSETSRNNINYLQSIPFTI